MKCWYCLTILLQQYNNIIDLDVPVISDSLQSQTCSCRRVIVKVRKFVEEEGEGEGKSEKEKKQSNTTLVYREESIPNNQ